MLIIIGTLLVIVGTVSFAYFTGSFNKTGEGASVTATTVEIQGSSLTVDGQITFEDKDILPGHENISSIKVTATGKNKILTYNLVWIGINTLQTPLKYYVYKTTKEETPSIECKHTTESITGGTKFYETCEHIEFDGLGNIVAEGEITSTSEEKTFTLIGNEALKATEEGNSVYYYVVLEFQNLDEDQKYDEGGRFEGVVTVEEVTDSIQDIRIGKIYKKENEEYKEVSRIPNKSEGYKLDSVNSTCDKNASLSWNEEEQKVSIGNMREAGITCNLYFEKGD